MDTGSSVGEQGRVRWVLPTSQAKAGVTLRSDPFRTIDPEESRCTYTYLPPFPPLALPLMPPPLASPVYQHPRVITLPVHRLSLPPSGLVATLSCHQGHQGLTLQHLLQSQEEELTDISILNKKGCLLRPLPSCSGGNTLFASSWVTPVLSWEGLERRRPVSGQLAQHPSMFSLGVQPTSFP